MTQSPLSVEFSESELDRFCQTASSVEHVANKATHQTADLANKAGNCAGDVACIQLEKQIAIEDTAAAAMKKKADELQHGVSAGFVSASPRPCATSR